MCHYIARTLAPAVWLPRGQPATGSGAAHLADHLGPLLLQALAARGLPRPAHQGRKLNSFSQELCQ